MSRHVAATHRIELPVPADRGLRFFTPAGERLWVPGWSPRHLHPADGRTEAALLALFDSPLAASEKSSRRWV